MTTETEPPRRFERFQNLPTEIRLMIWRLATTPRTIEIVTRRTRIDIGPSWMEHRFEWVTRMMLSPGTRPPAVLAINRESRYEALPAYSLAKFPSVAPQPFLQTPLFRFNPELDTLRLATWCRCHDRAPRHPEEWNRPGWHCVTTEKLMVALRLNLDDEPTPIPLDGSIWDTDISHVHVPGQPEPRIPFRSWQRNLVHLSFDASLFFKIADSLHPGTPTMMQTRRTCDELTVFLEGAAALRTCTITMASAPLSSAALRFPLPGDAEVTQAYNVRAVRIARRSPIAAAGPGGAREPRLAHDRAVLIYHDPPRHRGGSLAAPHHDLAIFELLDAPQCAAFTAPQGGQTALARRMSWLIRTAPGPRSWLHVLPPINPDAAFRASFRTDLEMLMTEWMLLESCTRLRRLSAVCHGICMPDYGV